MRIKDLFIHKYVLISNSALACNRYNWKTTRVGFTIYCLHFDYEYLVKKKKKKKNSLLYCVLLILMNEELFHFYGTQ